MIWRLPRRWFLPEGRDLVGMLVEQGQITLRAMKDLEVWAAGDRAAGERVRAGEHDADVAKRALLGELRRAFVTPIDPEDLFELSERLDRVLNGAKNLVRETEILGMVPDPPIAEMCHLVALGVEDLLAGFPELARTSINATNAADAAIRRQRQIEHVYRAAMSTLVAAEDLREVTGRRELYRRCARIGDAIEHVADRVWYAVVKRA